ncbi:hypothetical protein [Sphingorhabdus sp.]|uniref:hypothetical protein n=2 Tax=Sphingorhabdus sp. TaxID=1902408 RepID=UPI003BB1233C|nr:hypothetical protein [Sphingomonadales bacterium]MBL0023020.1 hypothetical protein [Sphingomonadales bacterium]
MRVAVAAIAAARATTATHIQLLPLSDTGFEAVTIDDVDEEDGIVSTGGGDVGIVTLTSGDGDNGLGAAGGVARWMGVATRVGETVGTVGLTVVGVGRFALLSAGVVTLGAGDGFGTGAGSGILATGGTAAGAG